MYLEQYTTLINTMSSSKMTPNVIESMLKDHQVFVFGEFLALEPIKKQMALVSAGKEPTECGKHFHTLHLFAFGNWSDYTKSKSKYLDLPAKMSKKLKMLTLAQACSQSQKLSYQEIAERCGLATGNQVQMVDEVDGLVLECISSQLIECRID